MISHERLKDVLDYDPETGEFRWTWHRMKAGEIAGSIMGKGHREIKIKDKYYTAQRLAWFYVHKKWPNIIAFANGDRSDTRIDNLMNVTRSYASRPMTIKNTSGTVGVHFIKKSNRWVANIIVNGVSHHLRSFIDKDDAIAARKAAEVKYGLCATKPVPPPKPVSFL